MRLTPTRVGQPFLFSRRDDGVLAHSHSRGTNSTIWSSPSALNESFPRTWDKFYAPLRFVSGRRLIPTHVGQTIRVNALIEIKSDSFPRTWDKQPPFRLWSAASRLIPTHVGQTDRCDHMWSFLVTHSHERGTNVTMHLHSRSCFDSFPRTWDKRQ